MRFFTVEVKPPWRVLIAAAKPAEQRALSLLHGVGADDLGEAGRARFDCQVIGLDELPQQALDGFAAVCLLGPDAAGSGAVAEIGRLRRRGAWRGDLPGPQCPTRRFLQRRRRAARCCRASCCGRRGGPTATLTSPRGRWNIPSWPNSAAAPAEIPWDDAPVYRYWELEPPPAGVGVVLPYLDGRPALLERPVGNGRVLTMTTPGIRLAPGSTQRRGTCCRWPATSPGPSCCWSTA